MTAKGVTQENADNTGHIFVIELNTIDVSILNVVLNFFFNAGGAGGTTEIHEYVVRMNELRSYSRKELDP